MKKRSTTTLQRFADGECPHERPVRSTSFQVSPPPSPLRKKKRKAASFSYGSLSSFFRRRSGNLYHHLLRIYTYIHTLSHTRTHARRFERTSAYRKKAWLFCDFTESTEEESKGGKRPLRSSLPPSLPSPYLSKGVASLSDGSLSVEVTRKSRDATHFVFNHSDG